MSTADVSVCANCGKGEEESDKLKACTACKLVKYCNRECQIAHRSKHKRECKKRAAELHYEELFKEPPSQFGDCPICFLPIPSLESGRRYMTCCGKMICSGCVHAPIYDHQGNYLGNIKCVFCRSLVPATEREANEINEKRVQAGDPIAIYLRGNHYRDGTVGFEQDMDKALELYHCAAKLGYPKAFLNIGTAYHFGNGVEVDKKKAKHYYELAAMGGNEAARFNLGTYEANAGNIDLALKHWMISVRSGYANALTNIKALCSDGHASKESYSKALQSYQTYLSEIKSDQRDKAAAYEELDYRYY